MKKSKVSVCFDRLKKVPKTDVGMVEIKIYLSREERKYFKLAEITADEWPTFSQSATLKNEVAKYEAIITSMEVMGKPMTLESLNEFMGLQKEASKESDNGLKQKRPKNFLDFFLDELNAENIKEGTRRTRLVTLNSVIEFGRIVTFDDLTPATILEYHKWLHRGGFRTETTVKGYHKRLHHYVLKAYEYGYISRDPYNQVRIPCGQSAERRPLTEEELNCIRRLTLPPKEERARDLFVFAAYTGLAYADVQNFDFNTMTERHGDLYYIDGSRLKTGCTFFTPIFQPAMDVLIKYNYRLPRISNQKLNDYLHLVESRAGLNKNLTSHLARHTFATLTLAHDVPIENVARMLGHRSVRTTQLYAKILKTSIQRHATNLANVFK